MRSHTVRVEEQNFSGLDITFILRTNQIQGTGLRGHHITCVPRVLQSTQHKGPESVWITCGDHMVFAEKHEGVGSSHLG